MICPRCGAQMRDGAPFCPKCGATIQISGTGSPMGGANPVNGNGMPPNGMPPNMGGGKKNNTPIILAVIGVGALIFAIVMITAFMAFAEVGPFKPDPTPTPVPTPTPTVEPTPIPQPTAQVVYVTQPPQQQTVVVQVPQQPQTNAVSNPSYKRYSSSEYGYSINYPSHFSVYNDGGTTTLYTVQSSDGSARELIAATPTGGATVSSSLNSYISSHQGSVSYKTSGSDYYAVNIKNGAVEYYKYCKFKNGNMYWFEFISPTADHDIYDTYINDIYNSIQIN